MSVSRRAFVRSLGAGGAVLASGAFVAARGHEAAAGVGVDAGRELPEAAPPIRLNSNENPNGPGPRVLEVMAAAFGLAGRYPYAFPGNITAAIAKYVGVPEDNVLPTCGSMEVLRIAGLAFTSPTRALVTAAPTYEDPERTVKLAGFPVRSVPVDASLRLDLAGMAGQATDAGLVFLCNPNNPTGTVHGAASVADFVREINRRAPGAVILVDEAYHEYVAEPSYRTAVPMALENPRVIVLRTFSKVFGLAGLRLGYVVGRQETLDRMRTLRLASGINVLAMAAGAAAVEDRSHIADEVTRNAEARDYTRRVFADLGYPCPASDANFILVDIKRELKPFQDACRTHGVLVGRSFPPLMTHARISIGTMAEMRQAADVFRRVLVP